MLACEDRREGRSARAIDHVPNGQGHGLARLVQQILDDIAALRPSPLPPEITRCASIGEMSINVKITPIF
jgi:hypothetical protein